MFYTHMKLNLAFLLGICLLVSCETVADNLCPEVARRCEMSYRFADVDEGAALLLDNDSYFNKLTPTDMEIRMGDTDATLDEYKAFAAQQVRGISDADRAALVASLERVRSKFDDLGLSFPIDQEIVIVLTTMEEEAGAGAYTHKNRIFLGDFLARYARGTKEQQQACDLTMAHEIFHVLTRNSPRFRRAMYAVIGFTLCQEPLFSDELRQHIITNPDIEQYDCKATFTIDGQPTECTVVNYLPDEWNRSGSFFRSMLSGVVPIDQPDRFYPASEVPDFWQVMGRNSDYAIGAEECMAENFSMTVVYGEDHDYPSPHIIRQVLDVLRSF